MINIPEDEWKEIVKKLVLYACMKTNLFPARGNKEILICSKTPKDIAYEAINKFITGERKWDPQKVPDLFYFLKCTVDSLVSHIYTSKEFTQRGHLNHQKEDEEYHDNFDMEMSDEPAPDTLLEVDELKDVLMEKVKNDEDMQLVLLGLFDGNKAKEISEDLGIPISDVRNILKRIRRIKI